MAARRLFVTEGYHGLSMRQIAEAVQISKAGIYHHFKDKEELFLAVLMSYVSDIETLIMQAQADGHSCRERITLITRRILAQPTEQRAMMRLASHELGPLNVELRQAFSATYYRKFIGRIEAILQDGMASGELRPIDTSVATWTLLGMLHPYFSGFHTLEIDLPTDTIDQMLTIYFDGITAR